MILCRILPLASVLLCTSLCHAQSRLRETEAAERGTRWQSTRPAPVDESAARPPITRTALGDNLVDTRQAVTPQAAPPAGGPPPRLARVTSGSGTLPNSQGQVWREYDITPFTGRITSTNHPEQAIVDWVLRETGYEAWHTRPLGILSANGQSMTVYHTPEMQDLVADVVDRFVNTEVESYGFSMRVLTIDNPNWRAPAMRVMTPVPVQTQGIQAWLVTKEDAAMLAAELRKRNDYREHSSPHLLVTNGQSVVVSHTRPVGYVRNVLKRNASSAAPIYESEHAQIDEGFSIEMSPLLSIDGEMIDAILKCNIDQVEQFQKVTVDVPTPVAPRQKTEIEVPQVSHCRLHERFRWPTTKILVVSLGLVSTPVPVDRNQNALLSALRVNTAPPRTDLLVVVECKGKQGELATAPVRTGSLERPSYRGRY